MALLDPVFEAYVHASESGAAAALERLAEAAQPAIREVCAGALGFDHQELEDACADALVRVVHRVRQMREQQPDAAAGIQNVAAYAAVTAQRVCADYLRRAHPVRARLGSRVRYALTHDPALQLRADGHVRRAGLAGWSNARGAAAAPALAESARSIRIDVVGAALLGTLRALLASAGGWIELGKLVSVLFEAAALRDPAFTSVEDVDLAAPPPPDAPGDARESRGRLEAAWREIVTLPPRQRAALLLHMRDEEGRSGLPLFALTGVADLAGLAAALEMTPGPLAELWPSLPLDDFTIAQRLGATRQQVINLRKSARARLGRRLAGDAPGVVIHGAFGRQMIREKS